MLQLERCGCLEEWVSHSSKWLGSISRTCVLRRYDTFFDKNFLLAIIEAIIYNEIRKIPTKSTKIWRFNVNLYLRILMLVQVQPSIVTIILYTASFILLTSCFGMEAYCVKCKAKRLMRDDKKVTMKNGKPATQGICTVCGTKMFRIGK